MKKEYDLKNLKKVSQGAVVSKKETKVRIGIRLDADVLEWATGEAEKNGLAYQTFINSSLRKLMNEEGRIEGIERRLERLEKKRA